MGLPKKLYQVVIKSGAGKPLGYAQRGGGTFAQKKAAEERAEKHMKEGRKATLYETTCNWVEIGIGEDRQETMP